MFIQIAKHKKPWRAGTIAKNSTPALADSDQVFRGESPT